MPQHQGIWTLPQQSQALTNQKWVTDPNFKDTTLLLQVDGTGSGSQNQTFLDSSSNNFYVNRYGNTTQGSFSPHCKPDGQWSNYQSDVSSNYLSFTTSPGTLFQFAGDFTVEAWVYLATAATGDSVWVTSTDNTNYFALNLNSANFNIYLNSSSSDNTIPHGLTIGQWGHIAMVRSGSTITLFTNGIAKGTFTNSSTLGYASPSIARTGGGGSNARYLSNLRIVKSAVYTANFTPQTSSLTNIANTSLLTCQSNKFVDNSSNALVPTITGTPKVQAFSPFAPARQWTPDVVGGSGYFDGTGDYLSIPSSSNLSLGTGDFTLECWVYPLSWNSSTDQNLFAGSAMYSPGLGGNLYYPGKLVFGYNGVFTIIEDATLPTVNTWTHVMATRASGVFRIFLNGTQSGSTVTYSANFSAPIVFVGTNGGTGYVNGYISGARVIKGTALYTSNFTPPTAPPTAVTNTQLLLNYTNAGIYDGTMNNNLETVGNAQVVTIPAKNGSGSMYFPPTNGNYCIGPPNQPHLLFGTGDFTIEAWVYPTAFTNTATGIFGYGLSGGYVDWNLELDTSGNALYIDNDGGRFYSNSNLARNTWTHVCIVRDRSQGVRLYFNGTNVNATAFRTINNISGSSTSARLYVGTGAQVPGSRQFIGYIDDLRITKGVARYLTNFTPPQQALPRQ